MGAPVRRGENKARLEQRRRQAIEMALAGASYETIARELGWKTRSAAYKAVMKMLHEVAPDPAQIEAARGAELQRLDRLQQAHWMNALRGDARATDIVLKISDRRSRLLGLDQPVQVEGVISHKIDAELEHMLSLLPRPEKG